MILDQVVDTPCGCQCHLLVVSQLAAVTLPICFRSWPGVVRTGPGQGWRLDAARGPPRGWQISGIALDHSSPHLDCQAALKMGVSCSFNLREYII